MIAFTTSPKSFLLRYKSAFALFVTVLLLTNPLFSPPALAQVPKISGLLQGVKQENEAAAKAVSPEQQREIAKRALVEAQKERDRALAVSLGISTQTENERFHLLDGLVTRISSQLSLLDQRDELRRSRTALEQTTQSWTGFAEPPPYSILLVDELMVSVLTARAKVAGLSTNQALLGQQVSQYREAAKQAGVLKRQTDDEFAGVLTAEERLIAVWQKELSGLRARNADAMAVSIALRYDLLDERLIIAAVEVDLLERKLAAARKGMVFSRLDLDKALAGLKSNRLSLEQELEATLARDAGSRSTLARTQQELNAFSLRSGKEPTSAPTQLRHDEIKARNRSALAWVESARFDTEVVTALIAINKSTATYWEKRYRAITGQKSAKRREILADFRKSREMLKPWLEYTRQQLEMYQAAEREQESRLDKLSERSPLRLPEQNQLAAIRLQRQMAERLKTAVVQADLERQSWLEDIDRAQQSLSATVRLKSWFGIGSDILQRVWRLEIFAVEDTVEVAGQKIVTSRGVTVGKSVGALLIFLVGYMFAGYLGRRFHRILIIRFGVGDHQANVIRRWLLAMTVFILAIITLNLARIPLTVFAFLGGALAIGVGFGTQTIIKLH